LCYLIEKYKNLNFFKKFKLYSFINFLSIKLLNFYNLLRNDFNVLFFNLIKRSITLNYFNIFIYKISSKFKKKSWFFFNKKKLTKIFKINNIFFDNIYLKTLLSLFNLKIKAFTYLLKQNHLWLLFIFIKIFLRKNMATYYGKRLWYIKSYIDYFFNYKNNQGVIINTFFLFPSYILLTAKMIAYVIRIRLTQKYSLGEILNKFVNFLNKESELIGFRITCHGRFTRRQRASHRLIKSSLKNKDKLLLNTFCGFVDYAYIEQPLKYGMCGIRIWLVKNPHFETTQYHSILRPFISRKSYKRHFFEVLKLKRCLTFTDLYKVNSKFDLMFIKNLNYKFINKKQKKLVRYLKAFHFMYYLKLKKVFAFDKYKIKPKLYSNAILKFLKKNIYLLY
jgi:hypothetical protein